MVIMICAVVPAMIRDNNKVNDIYFASNKEYDLPMTLEAHGHYVYKYSTKEPEKLYDIYKKFDLNKNYFPLLVNGTNCYDDLQTQLTFNITTTVSPLIAIAPSTRGFIANWTREKDRYKFTVITNSCSMGRAHDLIVSILKGHQIEKAIISDIKTEIGTFNNTSTL